MDELMAAAGRINASYGDSRWEPVRLLVSDDYPRSIAALQRYDVLLVNSELAGARQQLESGATVISPCDVYATAEALHQALVMPIEERRERAGRLRWLVEREDITDWLCRQLEAVVGLKV
jgi:trehalose 6-phosphate synthase